MTLDGMAAKRKAESQGGLASIRVFLRHSTPHWALEDQFADTTSAEGRQNPLPGENNASIDMMRLETSMSLRNVHLLQLLFIPLMFHIGRVLDPPRLRA